MDVHCVKNKKLQKTQETINAQTKPYDDFIKSKNHE